MQTYKLYDGKVVLQFDEASHVYYVNDERVWGVTSATGTIDKSGPLIYWAVNKMCIPFLKEQIKPGVVYDEIQLSQLFTEAATQHNKKKDSAANIGTLGHEWVESYIKYRINSRHQYDQLPYPEYATMPAEPINETLKNLANAFLKWESEHEVVFYASEEKIYSKKYNYAGTMDIEALVDGELCVVDLKTSNKLVDEYRFQVAAYMNARMEETGKKFKAYWILRVGKEKKINKDGVEEVEFEARRYSVKEDYKKDLSAFLGALSVYKRLQELKKPSKWNN